MPTLQWSDALAMDLPFMDTTHREFVALLGAVEEAQDSLLLDTWRGLVTHTQDHFDTEDRWMQDTRFASSNCHSVQHKVVLQVLREGLALGESGDLKPIRQMAQELAIWFPQHAQSMDAALAIHLRRVGYDASTGIVHAPQALPTEMIHGCAGAACSDPQSATNDAVTPEFLHIERTGTQSACASPNRAASPCRCLRCI
jgi:hemerythrin-like metal-binding protein